MHAYLVTVQQRSGSEPDRLYVLAGDLSAEDVAQLTSALLHDPVAQTAHWADLAAPLDDSLPVPTVEVAFRPGVTDNEAETIVVGAHHLGLMGLK